MGIRDWIETMRLWSLHPQYLDTKGLLALWREGLLAQKVLLGLTRGYRHHPQLERFRAHPAPVDAIAWYLAQVAAEAHKRGYHFDTGRIVPHAAATAIPVTEGQLLFERQHLINKLTARDPTRLAGIEATPLPELHPLFYPVPGPIASWERP